MTKGKILGIHLDHVISVHDLHLTLTYRVLRKFVDII